MSLSPDIEILKLFKDDILVKAGESANDLYHLQSGKLIVLLMNNSQVTPVAYLTAGEYIGELAFFDNLERSAYVVALEESTLLKISASSLNKKIPLWLKEIGRSLTQKIRLTDELLRKKGIKKASKELTPLTLEEQRHYYQLLS